MPSINRQWEGMGIGVTPYTTPPLTRSLPGSPPRLDKVSLSAMLGEFHRDGNLMTSSLPSANPSSEYFRASGETIEMTNDILDLAKPLPWDRLKRGTSTMSLDSLNENYAEPVAGETATLDDQDKTPVATCTCGKTTNFECWLHRSPFVEAMELTEEISQTCLRLVQELRSEPSGLDCLQAGPCQEAETSVNKDCDPDLAENDLPPANYMYTRYVGDTPCGWKKEEMYKVEGDSPSSKSSGSLASMPSTTHKSDISSSPDSYDLLYRSFEIAIQMEKLQLERGQSEGSSACSSLESLNRNSPKFQKLLSQKHQRCSPDGSSPGEVATGNLITGNCCNDDTEQYCDYRRSKAEDIFQEDSWQSDNAAQKVTFALLAKKKKKPEVLPPVGVASPVTGGTHWTELVSGVLKNVPESVPEQVTTADSSTLHSPKIAKRPHSLPIQLRHIQKPSSRSQQTPELTLANAVGVRAGSNKGVTRTLSAPEGFACSLQNNTGSFQDSFSTSKQGLWLLPKNTSGNSHSARKQQYQTVYQITPQNHKGMSDLNSMATGSPLISDSRLHTRDIGHFTTEIHSGGIRQPVLAMDINANFTEPQESDTFIPEHHHFFPLETGTSTETSPPSRYPYSLHDGMNPGVDSSTDWVPGPRNDWIPSPRNTWCGVKQLRSLQPPRTLDLPCMVQEEDGNKVTTCSRSCSTDSPPAVIARGYFTIQKQIQENVGVNTNSWLPKEYRDVGVSTDDVSGVIATVNQCPCNVRHITKQPENPVYIGSDVGVPHEGVLTDQEVKVCKKSKTTTTHPPIKDEIIDETHGQIHESAPTEQPSHHLEDSCQDAALPELPLSKHVNVKTWRVGDEGGHDGRTVVTLEECHLADAVTNRVVRIQNVGASTIPSSDTKRYIPHRPLKPIHQVDAEHRQRKVLEKLCGNAAKPLPPTVAAWPQTRDISMHTESERGPSSLPASLDQCHGQTQSLDSNSSGGQTFRRLLSGDAGVVNDTYDKLRLKVDRLKKQQRPLSLDVSSDYYDIDDSLPPQEMQVSPRDGQDAVDLSQKKGLVTSVESAVEHILNHFAQAATRSIEEKGRLGSSSITPDIGHLMLHYLCPAVTAILMDGLRPHTTSLFVGRFKTTLWNVVECTSQLGPGTRPLYELAIHLPRLPYLKTSCLRVNAYIMGLLNIRCLELWLEHIREHPDVVSRFYEPNALLSLCNGATKTLFDRLLIAIQPLSLLPFDLDYKFEYQCMVKRQTQQTEKEHLLKLHTHSVDRSAQRHASLRGSWLSGTASLFQRNQGESKQTPEDQVSAESLGGAPNTTGQRLFERNVTTGSSGQPNPGLLKTEENATPTLGVESPKDLSANKDSWSVDWIRGFVAASLEGTTPGVRVKSNKSSSSSSWSRFGSSISKVLDRVKPVTNASSTNLQQTTQTNRTELKQSMNNIQQESTSQRGVLSRTISPGSPVKTRCHHATMSEEELSFSKGTILTVKEQLDSDWLVCSGDNQSGLVHVDYIQDME